jgi:hypothetical protein
VVVPGFCWTLLLFYLFAALCNLSKSCLSVRHIVLCAALACLSGCYTSDSAKIDDNLELRGWKREPLPYNPGGDLFESDAVLSTAYRNNLEKQRGADSKAADAGDPKIQAKKTISRNERTKSARPMVDKWGVDLSTLKGARYVEARDVDVKVLDEDDKALAAESEALKPMIAAILQDEQNTKLNAIPERSSSPLGLFSNARKEKGAAKEQKKSDSQLVRVEKNKPVASEQRRANTMRTAKPVKQKPLRHGSVPELSVGALPPVAMGRVPMPAPRPKECCVLAVAPKTRPKVGYK